MQREGPSEPKMVQVSGKPVISGNGLEVSNNSNNFETVKANVKVRNTGKWFYEAKITKYGKCNLGWCTEDFNVSTTDTSQGVGYDSESWAYDGTQQQAYHGSTSGIRYGEYWSTGDMIGCLLDLDDNKIVYFRNGKSMEVAHASFSTSKAFSPAFSIARNQKIDVNFGKSPFKFPVTEVYPDVHPLYLSLTPKQIDELTQVFEKFKDTGIKLAESGNTGDVIKGQGMLEYLTAIGVDTDNEKEAAPFLISWKLAVNHQRTWEFTREEFVGGWALHGCYNFETMKKKLSEWRDEVKNPDKFRVFYNYIFDYIKEDKNIMPMEEAQMMWPMLGYEDKWPYYGEWSEYIKNKGLLSVTRDNWRVFGIFVRSHPKDLEIKEDETWPTLIDDFVEWYELKTGKRKQEEDEEEEDE